MTSTRHRRVARTPAPRGAGVFSCRSGGPQGRAAEGRRAQTGCVERCYSAARESRAGGGILPKACLRHDTWHLGAHTIRLPDLDLDLLRCFVLVAETRGFTAAGEALGLTQSAVSLRIKRLEEIVRRPLFERTTRAVAPTREGELLLGYARRLLALNDEAVRRLAAPPVAGRLRLGVADHFVPRSLAPILARFARTYPEVRLEVEVGRSHELRAKQAQGGLDLVLGKRRDGETAGTPIWTEQVVWAAAPDWAPPEDRPLPLALLPEGCLFRERALAALARDGRDFEAVFTCDSLLGLAAAAQAGFALTVLGRSGFPPGLVEVPGLPELGVVEMAVFGDPAGRHQAVEPLVGFLRESLLG